MKPRTMKHVVFTPGQTEVIEAILRKQTMIAFNPDQLATIDAAHLAYTKATGVLVSRSKFIKIVCFAYMQKR